MPTWTEFKNEVAAYVNRSTTDLVVNGVDLVLSSANKAKKWAQKKHSFASQRRRGFLLTNQDGAELALLTQNPNGAGGQILAKQVEGAWDYQMDGLIARRTQRIQIISFGDVNAHYSWSPEAITYPVPAPYPSEVRAYIQGTKFYLMGVPQAHDIQLDVIAYLPDYDAAGLVSDEFLTQHDDWLLLKTVDWLNIFLKEDQRVGIARSRLDELWQQVISLDNTRAEGSIDLDE